jgi:hypothetical protein
MKAAGLTYAQRLKASLGTGKPPSDIVYKKAGKGVVAVEK